MKSYLFVISVLVLSLCVLSCFSTASAEKADWKILQEDSYHNTFSYNAASVKRSAENIVKVSAKSNGAEYLYELDCKNKRARILEGAGSAATGWFAIVSGSGELLLFDALCP